jgi:hypothetical protein
MHLDVVFREEDDAVSPFAISATTAGFLLVPFRRGRNTEVDHEPDVSLVDPHAKRNSSDYYLGLSAHPSILT